jgi:hypothetical protein
MGITDTSFARQIDRRTFLGASFALATGAAAETPRLESFTQWLHASRNVREVALQSDVERIRAMDVSIQAWVQVQPQRPTGDGALSEIPFGVKDIIETKGLATEYGSPVYKGRIGTADAAIVRQLRQRGGVLLGKTQCAAFAYRTPPPTHNPRDLAHTPGGSSSGSAAAVAAGMVPVALGTQTVGSVLRPASFCGVIGFKASYGLLPMDGVLPLAKSLDPEVRSRASARRSNAVSLRTRRSSFRTSCRSSGSVKSATSRQTTTVGAAPWPPTRRRARDSEVRGDGHVPGALDESSRSRWS